MEGYSKARVLLMSGYGINCERETAHAFDLARFSSEDLSDVGGHELVRSLPEKDRSKIVHINDVIADPRHIRECDILVWPGGFSMGDDTGSGLAFAHYARDNLDDEFAAFVERDTLSLGVCNGFQSMTHLGFFPFAGQDYFTPEAVNTALAHNDSARYIDRWVLLKRSSAGADCVWTQGLDDKGAMPIPIAHGEGKFIWKDQGACVGLMANAMVQVRYVDEAGKTDDRLEVRANPNGSWESIAGISDPTGRFLGMMPHPERAIYTCQHPLYTKMREIADRAGKELPTHTAWLKLFQNAVRYFD